MSTFGYVRKEVPDPLIQQVTAISNYQCDQLFVEEESLKTTSEFDTMISLLVEEDTIIVSSLKTFGKTASKLREVFAVLAGKKVRVISVNDNFDTSTNNLNFYEMAELLYETDRYCCARLTKEGLVKAKRRGAPAGRPRIPVQKVELIKELRQQERYSMRQIADMCEVSVGTVCRYLQRM